jgi:hypothetical protein
MTAVGTNATSTSRLSGETGPQSEGLKSTQLTPIGSRVEASVAAPGELRQLIEVP